MKSLTLSFLALAAAVFAEEPKATPIEGGTTTALSFGFKFDIPKGWTSTLKDKVYILAPEGANASGVLEELYLLASDRIPDEALDGKKVRESVDQVKEQLLPGAELDGDPEKAVIGDFEGLTYSFKGKSQDGKTARLRAHVLRRGDYVVGFVEVGYSKFLKKRGEDVAAILGSFRKAKKPKTTVRAELVGEWAWLSNFTANNGGGLQTNTTLKLNADGSYAYHHDYENTNPLGATWGADNDGETWSATETSITFKSTGGKEMTCTLEKRNHPKNTGDPMIVIDGKSFVTTTSRDPWK